MAEFIEGKRPVSEALRMGVPVKRMYVAEGMKGDKVFDDITKRAHKMGISIKQVAKTFL